MKSPPTSSSKINPSIFKQDLGEQPVRLIKAAQASKLLNGIGHAHEAVAPHKKPEIRMIHSEGDYCDLEVICGCGESTRVRCWNTPLAEEKGSAK